MESLEFLRCCLLVSNDETVTVVEHSPYLLEEAVYAVDALGIPRLRLLERSEEHLVKTKCISTVSVADEVRIDYVEHRLRHLLDCPSADVLAILEDELCIRIVRHPSLERLKVETVVADDVHVNVDLSSLILILETERYECICTDDTIYEV